MNPTRRTPSSDDIALIGAACRFAETPDLATFWRRIVQGTTIPADTAQTLGALYTCDADAPFVREPPVPGEDHAACFLLQLIGEALADAGLQPATTLQTDRTALFLCHNPAHTPASVNWLQQTLLLDQTIGLVRAANPHLTAADFDRLREAWKRALPPFGPRTIEPAWRHVLPVRIAQALGIIGPANLCDTGWTSGITALEQAADALRARRCDMAIVAAIQPPISPATRQGLATLLPQSTRPRLLAFDHQSDGVTLAEGGTILILKRRRDVQNAPESIYAILRGTGSAIARQSLADCASLQVAPLADALFRSLRRACREVPDDMDAIDLYEANASGLPLQDQAELRFLQTIAGYRDAANAPMVVGTVKTAIGHVLTASALAAVLKAALALRAAALPPSCADDKEIQRLSPNLCTLAAPRPWIAVSTRNRPRRAAVASIDFTGNTAFALLEASSGSQP
ncbi:MAG: beta-ketoacyl synthase N-terminal-like domain-containing protein [Kiritimatiellia bacterium]